MPPEWPGCGSRGLQDGESAESAKKIEQCIAYMKQNLDKPLQVSTLSVLTRVSPSYFFALFKRATGHTPIDFFIHLRMRRACELLAETNLSVKEVAALLGYDDQFYFSRVFKAVNHIPPGRYRALHEQPLPAPPSRVVAESGRGANGNGVAAVSWPGNGRHQKSRIVHCL